MNEARHRWEVKRRVLKGASRRDFFRTFALFTASAVVMCPRLGRLFLGEVSAQADPEFGTFKVDISKPGFEPLLDADNGSMLVSVTGMPESFGRIVVTRSAAETFYSVTARCTHEGTEVLAYLKDIQTIVCPNHGSTFDPDGTVTSGPAQGGGNLARYTTVFDGIKTLDIQIPGLGYSVGGEFVPVEGGRRFRLDFNTVSGIKYEVRYRESLSDQWAVVPFALTHQAPAAQTVLNGTGASVAVYVDTAGTKGFYALVRY